MVDRTHDETKLWESFIKGETAAFEEVYRRYYSLLYSYGIRMVGDRELVADTIQNLFVKLILNCRNLHYTDNVKAYLLCSFRNKLLDAFQSLRPMEVIEECHEFFPMGEEIINSLFKKDDVDVKNERRLAKAISRLSGRQREILYLYYVKELSHQEISAILGMNPHNQARIFCRVHWHVCVNSFSLFQPFGFSVSWCIVFMCLCVVFGLFTSLDLASS